MHYMDASLRGLREEEKEHKARTDDVVVVRAGHSVRSVYDDNAAQDGASVAEAESAGAGARGAGAAAASAGARAGAAGTGAGGADARGAAAGEGPGGARAKIVTQEVRCRRPGLREEVQAYTADSCRVQSPLDAEAVLEVSNLACQSMHSVGRLHSHAAHAGGLANGHALALGQKEGLAVLGSCTLR